MGDGARLLDVGHLPHAGDGVQQGGQAGTGSGPRYRAVQSPLQQAQELLLGPLNLPQNWAILREKVGKFPIEKLCST